MKKNCWEFTNCGREPSGKNVDEFGVCPAAVNKKYNGLNHGKCAGRICWAVTGTFCDGNIQGTFAKKWYNCSKCDFFKQTKAEEGPNFLTFPKKLNKLHTSHENIDTRLIIPQNTQNKLINTPTEFIDETEIHPPVIIKYKEIEKILFSEINDKVDINTCINQLKISDNAVYSHTINVSVLASVFGITLGLGSTLIKELTIAALLHDIGKIRIPKDILYKSDNLKFNEIELIENHTRLGYQLIKSMGLPEKIAEVSYNHHERLDGQGYPRKLTKDSLSLYTQIVSIVNAYDILSAKEKNSAKETVGIMISEAQKAYSLDLLYRFINIVFKQDKDFVKQKFQAFIN
ncbi:MAG: hypothetical protein A2039_00500 [Candidatus Melainabacteria bacterium GWA2_34_9]|nr:MAG: hypothetical protein A2039_00500 [Candidatus Melainabacteria bacterium GWA2_34_9]